MLMTFCLPENANVYLGKFFVAELDAAKKVMPHKNIVRYLGFNTIKGTMSC